MNANWLKGIVEHGQGPRSSTKGCSVFNLVKLELHEMPSQNFQFEKKKNGKDNWSFKIINKTKYK